VAAGAAGIRRATLASYRLKRESAWQLAKAACSSMVSWLHRRRCNRGMLMACHPAVVAQLLPCTMHLRRAQRGGMMARAASERYAMHTSSARMVGAS